MTDSYIPLCNDSLFIRNITDLSIWQKELAKLGVTAPIPQTGPRDLFKYIDEHLSAHMTLLSSNILKREIANDGMDLLVLWIAYNAHTFNSCIGLDDDDAVGKLLGDIWLNQIPTLSISEISLRVRNVFDKDTKIVDLFNQLPDRELISPLMISLYKDGKNDAQSDVYDLFNQWARMVQSERNQAHEKIRNDDRNSKTEKVRGKTRYRNLQILTAEPVERLFDSSPDRPSALAILFGNVNAKKLFNPIYGGASGPSLMRKDHIFPSLGEIVARLVLDNVMGNNDTAIIDVNGKIAVQNATRPPEEHIPKIKSASGIMSGNIAIKVDARFPFLRDLSWLIYHSRAPCPYGGGDTSIPFYQSRFYSFILFSKKRKKEEF
jgi:hypothetical protein